MSEPKSGIEKYDNTPEGEEERNSGEVEEAFCLDLLLLLLRHPIFVDLNISWFRHISLFVFLPNQIS